MRTELTIFEPVQELPPLPPDSNTPAIRRRTEQFFLSIAEMFETWVGRKSNAHTQRSYRQGGVAIAVGHFRSNFQATGKIL